jgi:Domain of Unknown Function (DUF1080)
MRKLNGNSMKSIKSYYSGNHFFVFLTLAALLVIILSGYEYPMDSSASRIKSVQEDSLKITLPEKGRLVNGKPIGDGWVNLLKSAAEWNMDTSAYKLSETGLHGDYFGGKYHNFAWTKKSYSNFELQALVKLDGKDANSGVCIRLNPLNKDNAPGYQIDMGDGYWGCLWEEKRAGMVQKFSDSLAARLVKKQDWNHYYIIARGHHIEAWLNGVKTIDIVHASGFENGSIGFQLCHGDKHTILNVRCLYIKEII